MAADTSLGEFVVLDTWLSRMRGLLGTRGDAPAVLLRPCSSVHTFGMRYPLDVAMVGIDGMVLASSRSVPPCRAVSCPRARLVLERPCCTGAWPDVGDFLAFEEIDVREIQP